MKLIDTHTHLNFKAFATDYDEVIKRALENETQLIIVGSQKQTSERALEIAKEYNKGVYATAGLHPVHTFCTEVEEETDKFVTCDEDFDYEYYKKLAEDPKVVAIGECGLDYYRLPEGDVSQVKEKQKEVFLQHVKLAREVGKPLIVHCREAHDDLIKIMQNAECRMQNLCGVMHCFSGDMELAKQYIDLGFLISFTGLITFAHDWDEVIKNVPLEKIMIETDCPYMAPEPHRGKRNEPMHVKYVAEKIAELRGVSVEEVGEVTSGVARQLFNL